MLDRLHQEGCLKARFPRPEDGAWTSAVTLNSSGGVAQGDQLETRITAGDGTQLTVASQAAERYYRSPGGAPARVRTRLTIGADAAMEWLPQETILFDGCSLDRRLDADLAVDAWFLGVETLVFGRALMGETVRQGRLRDTIRLTRHGALLWHDAIRFDGPVQAVLDRPAVAAGGRAVATLLLAGPQAAGSTRWPTRGAGAVRGGYVGHGWPVGGADRGARWGLCARRNRGRIGGGARRPSLAARVELLNEPDPAREGQAADLHGRRGGAPPAGAGG